MDSSEISVEMGEKGPLEPLVITEEGDTTQGVAETEAAIVSAVTAESTLEKEEDDRQENEKGENTAGAMCNEKERLQNSTEEEQTDEDVAGKEDNTERDKLEEKEKEKENDGQESGESEEQEHKEMEVQEKQVDVEELNCSHEETQSQEDDPKKAHRLTPDFPESLYELLCTLQEGRRLNDQRCSFRLEEGIRRRRCHSEPNTTKPANRVVFSSMTSLQKEEFFDLVATAQARRLDDQRALLGRSPPPKPRFRSFRGSIKQLSFVRKPEPEPEPAPVPKEDLYNMILTTQAQGRLEDQRSRAPGPMDDEDFFSLLLRVQGGRMEEQRTELPRLLQT
ncbi:G-protein-signaling modulator 1 [Sphaeramia orbicularis]|uniref:G-protein-signaling modulator 1 n=1 Tax=Sphaeramia orbicularis TaxID=375764 RepID=UPI00117C221B|nr:G-protein-signaling modulator 1-like [Sphaeramia orbicularis]